MKFIKFPFQLLTVLTCITTITFAQPQKIVADKIVGQVGDKIILQSDIKNAIDDYKRQGQEAQLPPNPECAFLEGQLIQKVLVLQAQRDSLPISDEELDAMLDNQIRGFISSYGSQEILEQVAGKTVYQIKEDFREPFREKKLADDMRKKILDNIRITPTEVKDFFNKIPADSLPYYESELEAGQIVIYPKANKDIEVYVTNQLYTLKQQVESGSKKFADLAKIYSQDPGSKDNGGQYSINRTEKNFDPTFMAAAFKLKEGQVSPVIQTKFGLHIIQMVSRAGDDAVVRHILMIPSVTDAEINDTKVKLDTVRSKIIAGKLTFSEAVNKNSEDENSKYTAGLFSNYDGSTFLTIDQLDKDLVVNLKNMKVGEISQPLTFKDERGRTGVRLAYLKSMTQPHRENLKDDYNKIAQRALEEKKLEALQKWFVDHVSDYYISIDKEYNRCGNVNEWMSALSVSQ